MRGNCTSAAWYAQMAASGPWSAGPVGPVLLLIDALPGIVADDISGESRLWELLAVLTAAAEHAAR